MRRLRFIVLCLLTLLVAGLLAAQEYGSPSGGYLGVRVMNIDADRASALKLGEPRGVEIRAVQPGSPAEKAGLRQGDVVLSYNGQEILSAIQFGWLVSETSPGSKVKLQYWRDGKAHTAQVTVGGGEAKTADGGAPVLEERALGVPDFPRILTVWDNLALGIECEPIDSQLAEFFGVQSGILIRHVAKGMVGDRAGLKAGDVITSVDTREIAAPKDLISYLRMRNEPNKSLVIRIVRERKPKTLTISLQE